MGALSKICGIRRQSDIIAASHAGARYVGFVFFEQSPRHLEMEKAQMLGQDVPARMQKVALTVNPDDYLLEKIIMHLKPEWIQLHGTETPKRIREIQTRFNVLVMKAIGISTLQDLKKIAIYKNVADKILLDAKPESKTALPGGRGVHFDWNILENFTFDFPWMLAGGLNPDNVVQAIARTNAPEVDVSSGVENKMGEKCPKKIIVFVANALGAPNVRKPH